MTTSGTSNEPTNTAGDQPGDIASAPIAADGTRAGIVVGIDGSARSSQALRWALMQADATGGRVRAVACWEWPSSAGGFYPYVDSDLSASTREGAVKQVAEVTAALGLSQGLVDLAVIEGYPARVLVHAGEDADLLVVGSRGHRAFTGVMLGSVGLHCATHAHCPVVIIRDHTGHEAADAGTASRRR